MSLTPLVLIDTRIWYAGLDAGGFANKLDAAISIEAEESTTFGAKGHKTRVGGLRDYTATATILWQAGDSSMPDDVLWAKLGASDQPLTLSPEDGSVGDIAYVAKTFESGYHPAGDIGKILQADATWSGNGPVARGLVLHPPGTARTATGTGTAEQLGAVAAGERMYANIHVLSVAGTGTPTITVKLQSSATETGSYTDRITFSDATAISGEAKAVSGAITDEWWRVSWTISGTNPSFLFAAAAGIAAKG